MLEPKKLLDELLGSKVPGTKTTVRDTAGKAGQLAKDNPIASGLLAAVLLGTGAGRSITGSALKFGGLAAVAGLAYKAYQNYQNGSPPQEGDQAEVLPPPQENSFHPEQAPQGEDAFALILVRSMVAAARADGHIDAEERDRIAERLTMSGIGAEAEAFLNRELQRPVDVDELVRAAKTDAQKVELYTASRLAIEPQTRAERGYLDMLAGRLKLPESLLGHIEATVTSVKG